MRRKNDETNGNGNGHIKFRVIEFEIDGVNDTLAEGMKALTTALSKIPVTTTPAQHALPAKQTQRLAAASAEESAAQGEFFPPPGDENVIEETEEVEETIPSAPRPKRTASPPAALQVLSDIDLNTGKVSLADFVADKKPSEDSDNERFVTIAVWYKENHGLEEVNADRIYTAYRILDWVPPTNPAQLLRDLKAKKKWFDKGQETGGYKVNMLGLNVVLRGFGA